MGWTGWRWSVGVFRFFFTINFQRYPWNISPDACLFPSSRLPPQLPLRSRITWCLMKLYIIDITFVYHRDSIVSINIMLQSWRKSDIKVSRQDNTAASSNMRSQLKRLLSTSCWNYVHFTDNSRINDVSKSKVKNIFDPPLQFLSARL